MFGFACTETRSPDAGADLLRARARRAPDQAAQARARSRWLRPDCKTQVSLQYNGTKIERIDAVVVSTQHRDTVKHKEIETFIIENVIKDVLPKELLDAQDALSRQSDRPLRHRRAGRRLGPDRAQDHRRYLRRHGPSRRRRVLGQGPEQGGPQRGVHGPLRGEEHRRGGPGRPLRNPVRLRHRLSRAGLACTSTRSARARSTTTRSPTR